MCATEVGVPPLPARGLWGGMIRNVAVTREKITVFHNYVGAKRSALINLRTRKNVYHRTKAFSREKAFVRC